MKPFIAAAVMAAVFGGLLLGLILWDTPREETAVSPPYYREDTAHYLSPEGELLGGY